ncbi:MAG: OmpA family protein [Mucilaginibacter sp.]
MVKQFTQAIYKALFLLSVGVFAFNNTNAQKTDTIDYVQPFSKVSAFRTWSVGLIGGASLPFTDDYQKARLQPVYGGYIKNQILSSFGIQTDFLAGRAEGDNSADGAFSKYVTKIDYAVDLSVNITLANINWRHKKGVIQPYFTGGFGYIGYEPQLTTSGPVAGQITFPFKNNGSNIQSFYIPVSAGLKINLSRDISLDMGYQVDFIRDDNFDGLNYAGNKDAFGFMHIGLEIGIGNSKKPQLATHNPVASMRTEYLGIEQSLLLQIDKQKAEINKLKTDLDAKTEQINATNASLIKFTMDSDNDGVPDLYDKCPNTPVGTIVDGAGCPLNVVRQPLSRTIVTEQDKKVVKDAVDNLEFDFGKATLRPVSFVTLDRLAQLLTEKNLNLKLSGYTDNRGPDWVNLKLSKDRAEAIRIYLVRKGVNPAHITATGYGAAQPIADNNTAEGRQMNRRVEFNLY